MQGSPVLQGGLEQLGLERQKVVVRPHAALQRRHAGIIKTLKMLPHRSDRVVSRYRRRWCCGYGARLLPGCQSTSGTCSPGCINRSRRRLATACGRRGRVCRLLHLCRVQGVPRFAALARDDAQAQCSGKPKLGTHDPPCPVMELGTVPAQPVSFAHAPGSTMATEVCRTAGRQIRLVMRLISGSTTSLRKKPALRGTLRRAIPMPGHIRWR